MRFTPRLLLALLLLLQLWGCSFDRKVTLKCKGDCDLSMDSHAEEIEALKKEKK